MNSNTRMATRQIRLQQWAEIIRDRQASGMKINEYCQTHGITRDAYFYWLRKVREAALEVSGIEFVEIKEQQLPALPGPVETAPVFRAEATISAGDITISVNSDTPRRLLSSLMEVAANVK